MSYVVGIWRYILCSVASIYSILSGRCNVWMYSYDRLRLELLQPPHSDSIITYPSPNIEDCSIYFSYPVYRAILLIKKRLHNTTLHHSYYHSQNPLPLSKTTSANVGCGQYNLNNSKFALYALSSSPNLLSETDPLTICAIVKTLSLPEGHPRDTLRGRNPELHLPCDKLVIAKNSLKYTSVSCS